MTSKKFLVKAAFWVMVATLGSRLLGFLREVQLAYYFGLSPMRGAFTVAFKIPNLIRLLVADAAMSAAFIPVLAEYLSKENKEEAWKISSQLMTLTFIVLTTIVLICEFFMPTVIRITSPGFTKDPDLFYHTVQLSRVIFPIITILGISGVVMGILHSMKHFTFPAIAPIFWNIINLLALYLFYQQGGIYAAAWGVLVATFVQLLIQHLGFLKVPFRHTISFFPLHPAIKHIGLLMIPVTLSIGVINFNALVGNFFASLLGPAEVAAIDSAFRLFQLPQGMFAVAIGTVLFPVLSTANVAKQMDHFAKILETGLRQISFLTLPFTGWFVALSLPISRLCFERGNFTAKDSQMVAWALLFYSIGMSFTSVNTLFNRGFYSLKKTWLPLHLSILNILLNILLTWLFLHPLRHGGICLAVSLVSIVNFFGLCYFMKREVPQFKIKPILFSFLKASMLTFFLSLTSYFTWQILDQEMGRSLWAQTLSLLSGFTTGGIVYLALGYLFRFQEIEEGLILFKREKRGV